MTTRRSQRSLGTLPHGTHLTRTAVDLPTGRCVSWYGEGVQPPVVCLHGAGVSSRELLPLVSALAQPMSVEDDEHPQRSLGRQAWSIDLPGYGASAGGQPPLSLRELTDHVRGWLDKLTLRPVHLLGSSFGCQIAVDLAVRYPGHVRSCVLVGPTVDPVARDFGRQLWRWIANGPHEPIGMAGLVARDYRDAGVRRVAKAFREALRDRIEDRLPRVAAPTLVVRGEHDQLAAQAWAEEVTRLVALARLVVWPGAGHMVPYSHPDGLAGLVAAFTDEVDR